MKGKHMRFIFLIFLISCPPLFAQKLSDRDFQAGVLTLNGQIDSIMSFLPKLNDIDSEAVPETEPPDTEIIYRFDSLWISTNQLGHIGYFEFTSVAFTTYRGVHVGDSAEKVRSLYGEPTDDTFHVSLSDDDRDETIMGYFKKNSTLGITFYISAGVVKRISIGWGYC
ncbi:MAG: hypothetical protein WAO19_09655 [Candidatus Kryptoniota bacterium]